MHTLLYPIVRGLIATTLLLLIGILVVEGIVARRLNGRDETIDAHLRGWLSRLPGLLAWFLLMLSISRAGLQLLSFVDPGESITPELIRGVLFQGTWGDAWLLQSCAALGLLACSWLLRNNARWRRLAMMGFVFALLWGQTGMGHAVDEIWGPWQGRIAALAHLVGGGYWLGTLAVLSLIVFPILRGDARVPLLASVVRDFSVPARIGASLLLVSGVRTTWRYTESVDQLIRSSWGQMLLLKLCCLVGVATIGWWNWKIVTPSLEGAEPIAPSRLRRAVAVELTLGAVILAITALLVASPLPGHSG